MAGKEAKILSDTNVQYLFVFALLPWDNRV